MTIMVILFTIVSLNLTQSLLEKKNFKNIQDKLNAIHLNQVKSRLYIKESKQFIEQIKALKEKAYKQIFLPVCDKKFDLKYDSADPKVQTAKISYEPTLKDFDTSQDYEVIWSFYDTVMLKEKTEELSKLTEEQLLKEAFQFTSVDDRANKQIVISAEKVNFSGSLCYLIIGTRK